VSRHIELIGLNPARVDDEEVWSFPRGELGEQGADLVAERIGGSVRPSFRNHALSFVKAFSMCLKSGWRRQAIAGLGFYMVEGPPCQTIPPFI
jgi:hypothetical protein